MPSVPCVTARAKPSPSPNKRAAISPIMDIAISTSIVLVLLIFFLQMVCYNFIAKSPCGLPALFYWFRLSIR